MPVDAPYHDCECGFKGFVNYTQAREDVTVKLGPFQMTLPKNLVAARYCPQCGKKLPPVQKNPLVLH